MTLSYASWLPTQIQQNILTLADKDPIAKEQYIDYIYDTQFRCSLLTKDSNESQINHTETINVSLLQELYFRSLDSIGLPADLSNTFHRCIKQVMDQGRLFQYQDVINHIAKTFPGIEINQAVIFERLFHLVVLGKLEVYTEPISQISFEDNSTYIPERFIKYVKTLIENKAINYIKAADPFNNAISDIDTHILMIMNMLTQPTTRKDLVKQLSHLTITNRTSDGLEYHISHEDFLNQSLEKIEKLGYFVK